MLNELFRVFYFEMRLPPCDCSTRLAYVLHHLAPRISKLLAELDLTRNQGLVIEGTRPPPAVSKLLIESAAALFIAQERAKVQIALLHVVKSRLTVCPP